MFGEPFFLTGHGPGLARLRAAECPSDGLVAAVEQAVDAARESTFPFLGDDSAAPEHADAYAAASLWFAEVALHGSEAAEAAQKALRACDLAILRAGVDEWAALAEPIVRTSKSVPPVKRVRTP